MQITSRRVYKTETDAAEAVNGICDFFALPQKNPAVDTKTFTLRKVSFLFSLLYLLASPRVKIYLSVIQMYLVVYIPKIIISGIGAKSSYKFCKSKGMLAKILGVFF